MNSAHTNQQRIRQTQLPAALSPLPVVPTHRTPAAGPYRHMDGHDRQVMDIHFSYVHEGYAVRLSSGMGAAQGFVDSQVVQFPGQTDDPMQLGMALFDALFQGSLYARYISNRDNARLTRQELHIRLHLQETPELAALPWEYLYDADRRAFLSLSALTPVVRFIQLGQPDPPQELAWPIRILGVISSPRDVALLDVADEKSAIERAVAEINAAAGPQMIEIDWLEEATPRALQNALREAEYHILHFIGHGIFDETTQEGYLILEDADEEPVHLSAQALAVLLQDHLSLRLAVINACQGALSGSEIAFAGVAQTLIQAGLPAAIAMQAEISNQAATLFAQEFYGAVADGKRIHYALGEARKAIYISGNRTEWATPVLFSQVEDGQIFQMPVYESEPGYAFDATALFSTGRELTAPIH